jgi:hypothetical protein
MRCERNGMVDMSNSPDDDALAARVSDTTAWLEEHIWPLTRGLPPLTNEEVEELTGMNEMFDK